MVTNVNVCSHHSSLDLMEMFTCLSIHTLLNLTPSAAPEEEEAVLLLVASLNDGSGVPLTRVLSSMTGCAGVDAPCRACVPAAAAKEDDASDEPACVG